MLMAPLSIAMLRNYAAMPATQNELGPVIITVLIVTACMMALILSHVEPAFPWYWIGSGIALATAIGLCWRWRRMMALPPVIPAGRLAA
jgi:bacteriorhodopsin